MSRNFELMQQGQSKTETATASGAIPEVSAPGRVASPGSTAVPVSLDAVSREESLKLIQSVFLPNGDGSPKMVVFAAVDSGNGCSAVCVSAARSLASQTTGSVCIVDANLRTPSLPESFGVGNHFGLTDSLAKQGAIQDFTKPVGPDNLRLLSCGSLVTEYAGRVNTDKLKARLQELRAAFDFVLIDSPPLGKYADSIALGQMADGLVLVIEANSTRREAAASVTDRLRAANVRILGAVLNKRTFPVPSALYARL